MCPECFSKKAFTTVLSRRGGRSVAKVQWFNEGGDKGQLGVVSQGVMGASPGADLPALRRPTGGSVSCWDWRCGWGLGGCQNACGYHNSRISCGGFVEVSQVCSPR